MGKDRELRKSNGTLSQYVPCITVYEMTLAYFVALYFPRVDKDIKCKTRALVIAFFFSWLHLTKLLDSDYAIAVDIESHRYIWCRYRTSATDFSSESR